MDNGENMASSAWIYSLYKVVKLWPDGASLRGLGHLQIMWFCLERMKKGGDPLSCSDHSVRHALGILILLWVDIKRMIRAV